MDQEKSTSQQGQAPALWDGLGVGLFAVIAGALLIAERLGWISNNVPWGWPLVLFVFGVVTVARALKKK
jgi:hypothetical protein